MSDPIQQMEAIRESFEKRDMFIANIEIFVEAYDRVKKKYGKLIPERIREHMEFYRGIVISGHEWVKNFPSPFSDTASEAATPESCIDTIVNAFNSPLYQSHYKCITDAAFRHDEFSRLTKSFRGKLFLKEMSRVLYDMPALSSSGYKNGDMDSFVIMPVQQCARFQMPVGEIIKSSPVDAEYLDALSKVKKMFSLGTQVVNKKMKHNDIVALLQKENINLRDEQLGKFKADLVDVGGDKGDDFIFTYSLINLLEFRHGRNDSPFSFPAIRSNKYQLTAQMSDKLKQMTLDERERLRQDIWMLVSPEFVDFLKKNNIKTVGPTGIKCLNVLVRAIDSLSVSVEEQNVLSRSELNADAGVVDPAVQNSGHQKRESASKTVETVETGGRDETILHHANDVRQATTLGKKSIANGKKNVNFTQAHNMGDTSKQDKRQVSINTVNRRKIKSMFRADASSGVRENKAPSSFAVFLRSIDEYNRIAGSSKPALRSESTTVGRAYCEFMDKFEKQSKNHISTLLDDIEGHKAWLTKMHSQSDVNGALLSHIQGLESAPKFKRLVDSIVEFELYALSMDSGSGPHRETVEIERLKCLAMVDVLKLYILDYLNDPRILIPAHSMDTKGAEIKQDCGNATAELVQRMGKTLFHPDVMPNKPGVFLLPVRSIFECVLDLFDSVFNTSASAKFFKNTKENRKNIKVEQDALLEVAKLRYTVPNIDQNIKELLDISGGNKKIHLERISCKQMLSSSEEQDKIDGNCRDRRDAGMSEGG